MLNDDDDPVEREIPVYLCRELEDKLFILQFPFCPQTASNNIHLNIVKSQIKPENQEVRLEVGLDTCSTNYDKSHGEQIALKVDMDKTTNKTFPLKYVDRLKLESQKAAVELESCVVGTLVHGSLVLSSVKGIINLTSGLTQIATGDQENEAQIGEEEAKMVRVQFSKIETEKRKKARQKSYSYYCQKVADEPWYMTEYHGPQSPLSEVERQKFGHPVLEGNISLSSVEQFGEKSESRNSSELLSQKVIDLLKRVRLIKTSVAARTLDVCDKDVLPALQKSAVLIQGIWVLRSDIKYEDIGRHAVPKEQLIQARDYVLLQFYKGCCIKRVELGEQVRLPPDILHGIISELGVLNSSRVWVFSQSPDNVFMSRYPEIVEQQDLLWEARSLRVMEGISGKRRKKE